jgi:outer membrane protein
MIRLISIILALSLAGAHADAVRPKIALVRFTDIYTELPKPEMAEFEAERKEVMADRRAEEIRKLLEELKQMQAELQKEGQDEAARQSMISDYNAKAATIKTLQEEFEGFRHQRELEINRKVVGFMRETFGKISAEAQKVAIAKGYDWVIDSSGNTNTGLPVLLYAKDAPDISAEVSAALAQAAPAAVEPAEASQPATR